MASITIRNLDEALKKKLRVRAAEHGRSMEEEARIILRQALARPPKPRHDLGKAIHEHFAPLGGADLDLPPREPTRPPPDFSGPEFAGFDEDSEESEDGK